MDIKVNQINKPMQVEQPVQQQQADGAFKFTLVSHIEEQGNRMPISAAATFSSLKSPQSAR